MPGRERGPLARHPAVPATRSRQAPHAALLSRVKEDWAPIPDQPLPPGAAPTRTSARPQEPTRCEHRFYAAKPKRRHNGTVYGPSPYWPDTRPPPLIGPARFLPSLSAQEARGWVAMVVRADWWRR